MAVFVDQMMRRTGLVLGLLVALVMMPTRLMAQSLDELYQQAGAAESAGNYVEVENVMRKGIQLYPNETRFYYVLGLVLSALGKKEEAIAAYRQAIELDPKFTYAYYGLGNALSGQKKLEEAISAYRKAIELDPKYAKAYYNLGVTLSDLGKKEDAIAAYRKAIELDPNLAQTYYNLGVALYELGKKEDAISAFRKAIELDSKLAMAYYNLGFVLSDLGKKEDAIFAFRKVLNLPDNTSIPKVHTHAFAHNGLGFFYQQQGKLKEALVEYEAALKIDPKYEYAKNNRDKVLALLKQPIELAYTDTRYLRPDDPLTRPKRAVVLLTPLFPQGRNQQGTGFIIKRTDNKLWILTNRHVLTDSFYSNPPRPCDSVEVQIYPGEKPNNVRIAVLTSKIILIANDLDLALIELEASQLPADIQALAISDPSDNQPITTIGHPDKNPWQKDQGKVIDVDNEKLRLKISLAVGSSGSPVMTENYGVIGIIYKIDQEGTGYAIPINQIRQQLATWKVQLP
jgi:superkiller protein 3